VEVRFVPVKWQIPKLLIPKLMWLQICKEPKLIVSCHSKFKMGLLEINSASLCTVYKSHILKPYTTDFTFKTCFVPTLLY